MMVLGKLPIIGSDHKCLVCGTGDADKPLCYRNEDWCSELHRQVVVGERRWNPLEEASVQQGIAIRAGHGPILTWSDMWVYDADDDEYWPEETRTVFPVEK